ncbi:MAG: hypothetical protein WC372_12320 [Candidatus Neomarinimicrobiota bacterium]|jgi:hypothetical protein
MTASNYLEAAILDHIFSEAVYSAPTWYVGLSVSDPGEDGSGLSEPTDSVYVRQAVGSTTRTDNAVVNDADIEFPTATASWGTINYFALFDGVTASTANILGSAAVAVPKSVGIGDTVKFAAGALTVTMS